MFFKYTVTYRYAMQNTMYIYEKYVVIVSHSQCAVWAPAALSATVHLIFKFSNTSEGTNVLAQQGRSAASPLCLPEALS